MHNIREFDCVQFQRDIREEMLKEANYDLKELAKNIKSSLKDNDLFEFFKQRKEKEKQPTAA